MHFRSDKALQPVRVLHCIPTLGGGGAEAQLRLLAPRLVALGASVAVFGRLTEADATILRAQGVVPFFIRSRGNHNPAIMLELLRTVRTFRPTVLQTWLKQMDIMGGAFALAGRIPWILSERSAAAAYGGGGKDRLRQALGRRANLVIANSLSGTDYWARARKTIVIGNGVDLPALRAASGGPPPDAGLLEGRRTIVSVGRLIPSKGLHVLIDAIALARRSLPDIRLLLVGEGPELRTLRDRVAELDLDGHVHFAGFQRDPRPWLRSAEVFISMSRYEGQPNAVMEAAACGTPMILSDIAEHRLLIGDAAVYVPLNNVAVCADQLVSVMQSSEMRALLAAAGERKVAGLGADATADRYIAVYRCLSSKRLSCRVDCNDEEE